VKNQRATRVLFIWHPDDRLKEYLIEGLRALSKVELIFPHDLSIETLLSYAPDVDVIVGWRPTKELLLAAEKLSLFINPGAGVQHQIELFRELNRIRPVMLVNGHGNSYFTAQHAVALLLALTNEIILHHNWMFDGYWRKGDSDAISTPLRGRRIGLLGYGSVNSKVHRFLSGFDLEFAALRQDWEKYSGEFSTDLQKYKLSDLHQFLAEIDILIIAVPQTVLTEDLIQMRELELFGAKGLLVNVGRGIVVDEESLYIALNNKVIAGAAIDVWYDYNPKPKSDGKKYPFNYPFQKLDNVVLSPHRSASPFNDLQRWDEVIKNIARFAAGDGNLMNIVDLDLEY